MASLQIGPISSTVGVARSTIARRSTCRGCHRISNFSNFHAFSRTASRGPQSASQQTPGRRPFSQQSHRPRADSKVHDSKIHWYPIPVGLGVGFLGLVQFYKVYTREQEKETEDGEPGQRPKKRPRVRPDGPWPGRDPSILNRMGSFSPSDGGVLAGRTNIRAGDIEQVKGMTYTIDGPPSAKTDPTPRSSGPGKLRKRSEHELEGDEELVQREEEFARVNGISYTLPDLLSGNKKKRKSSFDHPKDESVTASATSVSEVRAELELGEKSWLDYLSPDSRHVLYYAVIYLAPGDYHRFHSPTNWVVERRRHFAGELYSVSPYLQRTMPGLFTLNERVVLLGRWRWGFFSYVPVGATNVGSIKINFDRELRTNSLTTDTEADKAAEEAANRGEPYLGYAEATYEAASSVLRGHALRRGEEMGGFQLGSTIVMVFEAPAGEHDENGRHTGGWQWAVEKGQTVKVGQALGQIDVSSHAN